MNVAEAIPYKDFRDKINKVDEELKKVVTLKFGIRLFIQLRSGRMRMTIKLILFLIIGISIGIGIADKVFTKSIESKEDLIKTYDEYIEFLEGECIEVYKKALDDTLKQNIELKKKLKAYE